MTIADQLKACKGIMKLPEFAEFMRVSYDTVYNWIRECGLPAQKIRGTYWIDPEYAARWWEEQQEINIPKPPGVVRQNNPALRKPG